MTDLRETKLRETLESLIDKFEKNRAEYMSKGYLEAQLREDFIDLLFEDGLGWDVPDRKALGARKREVMVEKGESGNRPDYNFRINGEAVLYLETKKPAEDLDNVKHILQAKNYAWSERKVNIVALTDFEGFRLFDATLKPDYRYPDQGEIFTLHYTEYLDNLDKLLKLHRDAVAEGSLDEILLKDRKSKQLRKPPDKAFLEDLNEWRKNLASGLYKKSGYTWDDYEISEVVQKLLDRLIFIRIAEERNIIEPRQLQDKLNYWNNSKKKLNLYNELLVPLFKTVNADLDGDLFKPGAVDNAPFDDEDVADLIDELYPPKSIYRFDVMPIEIIGQAYEQYLSNIIRCTPKTVKLEPKPEFRRGHGVYYTPKYIVDYIVANTVGELIKGKTPEQVEQIKILDPACGSGSFLIGALEYLIEYVEEYYHDNPDEIKRDELFPYLVDDYDGEATRLSLERKLKLLNSCIYGVDIDPQAVEVTKLSLYLKVLENEHRLPQKRELLQSLQRNIKCGNSLIGSDYKDFASENQGELFIWSEVEKRRVNTFDWDAGFPDIVKYQPGTRDLAKDCGFDAVIGNPPYVRGGSIGEEKEYFIANYETFSSTADLYVNFVEKALKLTKEGGRFSYIVSNKWMRARYGEKLRAFVKRYQINKLVDFGELKVFEDAATFPLIIVIKKIKPKKKPFYAPIKRLDFADLSEEVGAIGYELEEGAMEIGGFSLIPAENLAIIERMKSIGVPLGKYVDGNIRRGVLTGYNKAFIIDREIRERLIKEDPRSAEIIKPFVVGDDVRKYRINYRDRYIILSKIGTPIKEYPAIYKHLNQYEGPLKKRWDKGDYWWELRACVYYSEFEKPKIVWPEIAKESRFSWDDGSYYNNKTCFIMPSEDFYLLGVLNSKLVWEFLLRTCPVLGDPDKKGRLTQQAVYVTQIPIKPIDENNAREVEIRDRIVANVKELLNLNKRDQVARSDNDKRIIKEDIDRLEQEIDEMVEELYGVESSKEVSSL